MIRCLALAALLLAPVPQDKEPKDNAPKDESVVTVEKGSITPTLDVDAGFESIESAEIRLKMEAYQGELTLLKAAALGEIVHKGDPILSIDKTPLERQILAAENELRLAHATLKKAEADARLGEKGDALALAQAESALKNAETDLRVFDQVDGKHLLDNADLNEKFSEDAVNDQQEELDQLRKMYKSEDLTNATAEIVVKRAERNLKRSKIQLEMTKEETKATREDRYPQQRQAKLYAVDNAGQALESLKVAQALSRIQRETDVARAKAAVVQQEEALGKLRKDLETLSQNSPIDGRVFYGPLQQGAWANAEALTQTLRPGEKQLAGSVILTICGEEVRLRADLPEGGYFDAFTDQSATVTPVATGDAKMAGHVRSKGIVAAAKAAGPSYELRIDLKEQKAGLLPGMKAKVTLTGKILKDVVLVPSNAIAPMGAKFFVTVSKDGKAAPREVGVGKTDGKMTEIRSGLEAGEKIVVTK